MSLCTAMRCEVRRGGSVMICTKPDCPNPDMKGDPAVRRTFPVDPRFPTVNAHAGDAVDPKKLSEVCDYLERGDTTSWKLFVDRTHQVCAALRRYMMPHTDTECAYPSVMAQNLDPRLPVADQGWYIGRIRSWSIRSSDGVFKLKRTGPDNQLVAYQPGDTRPWPLDQLELTKRIWP